jgi:putative hydrolase of the HAD superfamily
MHIRAVTFDCWGTLLLDGPGSDERYKPHRLSGIEKVLGTLGVEAPRQRLSEAYEQSGQRLAHTWNTNRDVPVRAHIIALLEALDSTLPRRIGPQAVGALIEAYATPALMAPPAVDQGAIAALQALASNGIALSVVSNTMRTPGTVLGQILERAGLTAFKVMTFSDECRIRKPDPNIFHLTLRQLGVAPEHAVHVGDDPILDVEGAREAGMSVIQVAPDGRANAPTKPDGVVRGLHELPAALARLAESTAA